MAPSASTLRTSSRTSGWASARDALFNIWRGGVEFDAVEDAITVMTAQDQDMWMRSGRVIESSYRQHGSPLAALDTPPPTLHVYGQPHSPEYLELQRTASTEHPWFSVEQLDVRSHFSMTEAPAAVAAAIERFITRRD